MPEQNVLTVEQLQERVKELEQNNAWLLRRLQEETQDLYDTQRSCRSMQQDLSDAVMKLRRGELDLSQLDLGRLLALRDEVRCEMEFREKCGLAARLAS